MALAVAALPVIAGCHTGTAFRARLGRDALLSLSAGNVHQQVALSYDIAGCHGQLFDRTTNENFGTAHIKNTVLDTTEDGEARFVLVSAVAAPNCNVQGRCGAAGSSVTLIWLHLAADLTLIEKQVFAVEDCYQDRAVQDEPDGWRERLALTNGVLMLRFLELNDNATGGIDEVPGTLTYDRRAPRAGLQVVRQ